MSYGGGYDHCFVFDKSRDKAEPYAVLYSAESGIEMKCYTDMPAVQFYAGNCLDQKGKNGHYYGRCGGLCLETQAIPNNVNVSKYAAYGSSDLRRREKSIVSRRNTRSTSENNSFCSVRKALCPLNGKGLL